MSGPAEADRLRGVGFHHAGMLRSDRRLDELVHRLHELLALGDPSQRIQPRTLATIVWALATLTLPRTELARVASQLMLKTVVEFNAQDMANTVWAFAK